MAPIIQAIPSILAIVVCTVIVVLLVLNYILNRFFPTVLLIIFFFGIDLWSITKLVSVFLPETGNTTFILAWKIASLSILILSLLVIGYFRDLLSYSTVSVPAVASSFLAGLTLGALWFSNFATIEFDPTSGWNTDYDTIFMVLLLSYLLVVYVFMFIMLIRGLVKSTSKSQKTQISIILTGLAVASIGGTIINYLLNLVPALNRVGDLDLIFVVVGFTIVAFAYLRSPIQIYFAPVVAHRLIVVNNAGIPMFHYDFCQDEGSAMTVDPTLVSGALSGVIGILKEILESEEIPQSVRHADRVLLVEKTEHTLCVLIADSETMVLRSALKDFGHEFEKMFADKLPDWDGLLDDFVEAYSLVVEDFPFVITSTTEETC